MSMKAVSSVMLAVFLAGLSSARGAEPPQPAQGQAAIAPKPFESTASRS